jgi:hypothetical protein
MNRRHYSHRDKANSKYRGKLDAPCVEQRHYHSKRKFQDDRIGPELQRRRSGLQPMAEKHDGAKRGAEQGNRDALPHKNDGRKKGIKIHFEIQRPSDAIIGTMFPSDVRYGMNK